MNTTITIIIVLLISYCIATIAEWCNDYGRKHPDPVNNCSVYKTEGCAFVDDNQCDVNNCPILKSLTYKDKTFNLIEDKTINEPCDVCDFKPYCEDFIKEKAWLACGAITPNHIYLKYGGNN